MITRARLAPSACDHSDEFSLLSVHPPHSGWRCATLRRWVYRLQKKRRRSAPIRVPPESSCCTRTPSSPRSMSRVLNGIVAVCPDLGIGCHGNLPWHPVRLRWVRDVSHWSSRGGSSSVGQLCRCVNYAFLFYSNEFKHFRRMTATASVKGNVTCGVCVVTCPWLPDVAAWPMRHLLPTCWFSSCHRHQTYVWTYGDILNIQMLYIILRPIQ